jgi:pimeloyl-ACP methyl ester carboxylesterase
MLAVTTAGVLGVSGLSVASFGGGAAAATTDRSTIAWSACSDALLSTVGGECGFVTVPLNWSKPSGKKIKIAVSRVRAKVADSRRQGVILVNPGGPGGSGLVWPGILQSAVPDKVGREYDWIGFDPRGVGESRPAISCDKDYMVGPRPAFKPASANTASKAANEKAWIARTKGFVKACAKNGELLSHVKSVDTVRDMEAIRKALGESQINYYGFSYGTYLGQLYSSKYPTRMRRMVLDGNVPPSYPGYGDGGRGQMVGFEGVIEQFFTWVATYDDVYHLGNTAKKVRAAYNAEVAKLTKAPKFGIGASEFADAFLLAGYSEARWPAVAGAFADWREGRTTPITTLYYAAAEPGNDNSYAAFNATLCTDGPFPKSYEKVRKDAYEIAKVAPFVVWGSYWYSQPCTYWPIAAGTPATIDGAKSKGALLINATKDGATPFAGALAVRKEFPKAALVAEVGATTHSGSLRGNRCVDNIIADYLEDGSLPKRKAGNQSDVNCNRVPLPKPSPLDRSQARSDEGGLFTQSSLVGALLDGLRTESRS